MTPEYVHLCLCYITMDIKGIVSTMQACIVYCVKSNWYITRDLLFFIYVYTYGYFKRWWILRTVYLLSFIACRFTWNISLLSPWGFKCTFAFYDFYHVPLHEVCCMYHHIVFMLWVLYMLCPNWRIKDVQSIRAKIILVKVKLLLNLPFLHVYILIMHDNCMIISWHGSVFHVWPFFRKV